MTTNEQTIQKFYKAFQNKDYKTMQGCYGDNATFTDPVFTNLNAAEARAMWEMFCIKSKEMKIEFRNITADETKGKAEWIATYVFSSTGKKVVNRITANFVFENKPGVKGTGKIVKHTDSFNFYKWATQALGPTGFLLGWTPMVKNKVQKKAMKTLTDYINRK